MDEFNISTVFLWEGYAPRWGMGASARDVAWDPLYEAAIRELDCGKLHKRIEAAQEAIGRRLEQAQGSNHDGMPVEGQHAIFQAVRDQRISFSSPIRGEMNSRSALPRTVREHVGP
jgi:hypothetical protein